NHLVVVKSDTTVYFDISAWKDDFAPEQKKHTASANVHVLDTAFRMPQLGRNRRITVYLPPGYHKSGLRYPVLYMHDGQNLFDEYTSGFGEWGVDETLDSLIAKGRKACIVVGIDNGPQRLTEYNPFYFERFGAGEGDAYLKFLTATLKPFIDFKYRTLPTKENTIIAGSSMGGLISYYALLKYPRVFGKAGVFSPAFWTADSIYHFTDSLGKDVSGMAFFYMGGLEGGSYVEEMQKVADQLGEQSQAYVFTVIDPEGRHNEASWKKWFAEFYQWIVKDGNNHIVTPDD
ncbi:MAG: alpha/beta hydrolase, partial [Chitinophagaceae bacterium]